MARILRTALLGGLFALATVAAASGVTIRIVYDNTAATPEFEKDWGFSALVDVGDRRVLFDSGADPDLFLRNLARLHVDPRSITDAVISHRHSDHRGGIYRLALKNHSMKVYFLDSFPADAFEIALAVGMNPVRVKGPREIVPGVYTTGPVSGKVPEQALAVETRKGLLVLVGSSHPGVVRMVETVERQRSVDHVRLLLGGFHMLRESTEEVERQIEQLRKLGVRRIGAAHSTGEAAKHLIRHAWGKDYVAAGAGRKITLE